MQAKRFIIGYIFYICLSLSSIYIYGFSSLSSIWTPILTYFIITYFFHITWSSVRKTPVLGLFDYFIYFLYKSATYLSVFILIVGSFFYYQNNLFPAKLPSYTLSNDTQTIVFQTMSHIGSEEFYKSVQTKVNGAKLSNYVLYYEGVLPGNPINTQQFDEALGIKFTPGLYDNFSKLYGVRAQDNSEFIGLVNNRDYNIDLSLDKIMQLYREKTLKNKSQLSLPQNQKVHDLNIQVVSKLSTLSEKELIVLRYINQALLNFMMKHEGLRDTIISKLGNTDIFSVILEDRNKHLAAEIFTRKDEKIIILYGLMHFPGVLELLQNQDPNWKIVSTEYSQVITR